MSSKLTAGRFCRGLNLEKLKATEDTRLGRRTKKPDALDHAAL